MIQNKDFKKCEKMHQITILLMKCLCKLILLLGRIGGTVHIHIMSRLFLFGLPFSPRTIISVTLFVFLVGATKDTDSLKSVTVPLIGLQQCRQMYQDSDLDWELSDSNLCAGYVHGVADACKADSGGPLTCKTEGNHTMCTINSSFSPQPLPLGSLSYSCTDRNNEDSY